MTRSEVNKREIILITFISLLTITFALLPVIYGYLNTPDGFQFAAIGRDDEYGLFAWAKQSQQGKWLFLNPYSTEAKSRMLFNPLFLLLGKLSLFLGKDLVLTFNLARAIISFLLLTTAYYFFSFFFEDFFDRLVAFLLLSFSSGLGWLLFFVSPHSAPFLSNAIGSTESLTFPSLLFYPHFTAALILLIICFLSLLKFMKEGRVKDLFVTFLCGSLLIATHPHETLTLVLAPIIYLFFSGRSSKKEWLRGFLFLASLAPMASYFAFLSQFDPVYKQFTQQPLARLTWPDFLAVYGLLVPLGCWGVYNFFLLGKKGQQEKILFILAWIGDVLLLLLIPFSFQRKMVMGFHFPLVILVVFGLQKVWEKMKSTKSKWLTVFLLLVILFPQNLYFLNQVFVEMRQNKQVYYLSEQNVEAQQWLETNVTETEIVLANPSMGLVIPALSGRRVFLGHWGNTNLSEEKAERLWNFFDEESSEKIRRELFSEYKIAYYLKDKEGVPYNRWVFNVERVHQKRIQTLEKEFDPAKRDYLELVFENAAAAIYRVKT